MWNELKKKSWLEWTSVHYNGKVYSAEKKHVICYPEIQF